VWIITAWKYISPEVLRRVLRGAVHSMQWMRLMVICCGMAVKRMGMSEVGVPRLEWLPGT